MLKARLVAALVALPILLTLISPAKATLTLNFSLTGDDISGDGFIEFSDLSSSTPGATVTDFSFSGLTFDLPWETTRLTNTINPMWEIDAGLNLQSLLLRTALTRLTPEPSDLAFTDLILGFNRTRTQSRCIVFNGGNRDICDGAINPLFPDNVQFSAITLTDVNAPETLGLFALSLIVLGYARRRRAA